MKKVNGFTLVEIVIVIAILGILAGIAIPHFLDSQAKTRSARAAADMRTLQNAVEQYMAAGYELPALQKDKPFDNGKEMFDELKEKGFIDSIPEAPQGAYYYAERNIRVDYPAPAYGIELSSTGGSDTDRYIKVNFLDNKNANFGIYLNRYLNIFIYGKSDH